MTVAAISGSSSQRARREGPVPLRNRRNLAKGRIVRKISSLGSNSGYALSLQCPELASWVYGRMNVLQFASPRPAIYACALFLYKKYVCSAINYLLPLLFSTTYG